VPHVPTDRINGDPIRYRLVDGKPVTYSVGDDHDHDCGKLNFTEAGDEWPEGGAPWRQNERSPDADWILYKR
jgi:hypothetical protein